MKKSISLEELRVIAREVFERNPNADKVYATRLGQVFLPHALNAAQMHARDAGVEKPLKIYTITREDAFSDSPITDDPEDNDPAGNSAGNKNNNTKEDPDAEIKEMITKAVELQIIKKAGNFYSFKEQKIGQGLVKVVATLKENVIITQEILGEIAKSNEKQ